MIEPTLDLHLFMISINSFLPIPVSRKASAALKLGMLSYGCSANMWKEKMITRDDQKGMNSKHTSRIIEIEVKF